MRDLLLRAGRHAGVALTGDGGDPSLLPGAVVRHVGRVPSVALARGVWQTLRRGQWPPLGLHSGLRRWTAAGRPAAPSWLAARLRDASDPAARWAAYYERRAPVPAPRGEALAVLSAPGWSQAFESVDPNTTGLPVELRYPFFDARVISLALSLPSYPWCVDKTVLREAMIGRLPEVIRLRPKTALAGDPVALRAWPARKLVALIKSTPGMDAYVDVDGPRPLGAGPGPADRSPTGDAGRGRTGHLARDGGRPDGNRMTHRFSAYGLAVESNVALPGVAADSGGAPADVIVRLTESEALRAAALPGERAWYVSPERDDAGHAVAHRLARRRLSLRLRRGGRVQHRPRRRHRRWRLAPAAHRLGRRQLRAGAGARVRASPARHRAAARRGGRGPRRRAVVHGPRGRRQVQHGRRHGRAGPCGAVGRRRARARDAGRDRRRSRLPSRQRLGRHGVGDPRPRARRPAAVERQLRQTMHRPAGTRASAFAIAPVPVGAIYLLQPPGDQDRAVRGLSPREALLALAANSYGGYLLDRRMREVEFDVLGAVARLVPVQRAAIRRRSRPSPRLVRGAAASRAAGD